MKVVLLVIGKTDAGYFKEAIGEYARRVNRYISFDVCVIPDVKNAKSLSRSSQKEKEYELIVKQLLPGDSVVLLDERGKSFSSVEFAQYFEQKMNISTRRLVFVVGGPYGFSSKAYNLTREAIRLSSMTFSHQMVRLIFVEQLYRAMTILRGEPYHHE